MNAMEIEHHAYENAAARENVRRRIVQKQDHAKAVGDDETFYFWRHIERRMSPVKFVDAGV